MNDVQRLEALLDARHPCVWVPGHEEDYCLRVVRDAAMGRGRGVRQWSVLRGITDGIVGGGRAEEGTEHPAAALFRFGEFGPGMVCVALDLVPHLSDERTLRAARELLGRMCESGGCLVLIDHSESLPAPIRAYATRFEPSLPDGAEVEEIVVRTLRRLHRETPVELGLSRAGMRALVGNLRGLSRRHVEQLIIEAVAPDRRLDAQDLARVVSRKRELVRADGLLEFVQAPASMDQIGGLGRLKAWLEERRLSLEEGAVAFGLTPPRGLLMLGVQGAGKSLCAKAIATAWNRPLLRLDPGVLYDRYIGESERRLRDALRQAEVMAPIVLWIDEIEKAIASAASRSIDGGLSQRMFGTLLTWLQEHREPVFVAATANDVEALPPELLRKGRFDEVFFVDLPGAAARAAIFRIQIEKNGRSPAKIDLEALAAASEGYSGAEIEQAVKAALYSAYASRGELTTVRLLEAVGCSPPLSVTMAERIERLRAWARGRCVPAD